MMARVDPIRPEKTAGIQAASIRVRETLRKKRPMATRSVTRANISKTEAAMAEGKIGLSTKDDVASVVVIAVEVS